MTENISKQEFNLENASVDDILNEFARRLQIAIPGGIIPAAINQAVAGLMIQKGIITFDELVEGTAEIDAALKDAMRKHQEAQQRRIITPAGAVPSFDPNLIKNAEREIRGGQ